MRFLDKLLLLLKVKWKPLIKNNRMFIYKKASTAIHPTSQVCIQNAFHMNKSYGHQRHAKEGLFKLGKNATFTANDMLVYEGTVVAAGDNAKLHLGSGYINCNCEIRCFDSISIGENVAIAKEVIIRDSDSHQVSGSTMTAPIVIGNHVWIGTRAMILKGVTIGDGAVIGAGAIVTRDIPANSVAAGVPARVVKENITWS